MKRMLESLCTGQRDNVPRDFLPTFNQIDTVMQASYRKLNEVRHAPVWEYQSNEHAKLATKWFLHGTNEAKLGLLYITTYKLPSEEMTTSYLEDIAIGFMIHDLGKIDVPNPWIWHSQDPTSQDLKTMRDHVYPLGVEKLDRLKSAGIYIPPVSEDIVLHHHERMNGKGKPFGIAGSDLSFAARLAGGVDSVISRFENHPYHPGSQNFTLMSAAEDVYKNRGDKFDPEIIKNLKDLLDVNLSHYIYLMSRISPRQI